MAEILARPTGRPDFCLRDLVRFECCDVAMKGYRRPVPFENLLAEGVDFAVEHGINTRLLEAEIEAANAREE